MSEVALRLPGGRLPIAGTLLTRFTMGVSTSSNVHLTSDEIEDLIDIREARSALADPAPSIPLDDVLARYAAELSTPDDGSDW